MPEDPGVFGGTIFQDTPFGPDVTDQPPDGYNFPEIARPYVRCIRIASPSADNVAVRIFPGISSEL